MKLVVFLFCVVVIDSHLYAQKINASCTVIDISKDEGTFTIRDIHTGRIYSFKPDALEGAELKIGDTVKTSETEMKVTAVKGTEKSYDLLNAPFADSCCTISKLDTAQADSIVTITAKSLTNGEDIRFNIPLSFAEKVHQGNTVFTKPSHGYAMLAFSTDSARKMTFGFPLLQQKKN